MNQVTAFAPATVANVGCAFDVVGLALNSPGDTITVKRKDTPGIIITELQGDNGRLPTDPTKNSATVAAQALISTYLQSHPKGDPNDGFSFCISKGLPIGSGLGSSSASSAAAVVALNELLGSPFSRQELVRFAMEGERVACGSAHADNVAPAILGGFVLIRSYDPLEVIQLPTPSVWVAVVTPLIELKTADARRILRRSIELSQAVAQWGNVAGLIAGIFTDNHPLIGRSLEDHIVEPERSQLIPGFREVKEAALSAGALGCSISGAGPSIFTLTSDEVTAHSAARAMQHQFASLGIECTSTVSPINAIGATIISRS